MISKFTSILWFTISQFSYNKIK